MGDLITKSLGDDQHKHYQILLSQVINKTIDDCFQQSSKRWMLLRTLTLNSVEGGKRLRALCALIGYLLAGISEPDEKIATMGAALEFYQASALTHDDLIDKSTIRRNLPTTHVLAASRFNDLVEGSSFSSESANDFGKNSAILVGDLTLSLAFELCAKAVSDSPQVGKIFFEFSRMTSRVAQGQFLDISLDYQDIFKGFSESLPLEVISYKTAGYSVADPLYLGALTGGLNVDCAEELRNAILPWGVAFQLRDDMLGVFAQTKTAGKPKAHDIAEGKRTLLLAKAMQNLSLTAPAKAHLLAEIMSLPKRNQEEIDQAVELILDSGADKEIEEKISYLYNQGLEKLECLSLSNTNILISLGQMLTQRER
ncbi:polyprenyl synthetase family protein [Actinomycetaceae bacterium TAE3-ERU4]|nr:polyprenyl synthetase family protein [Actinomycetaceae bacterium TAE3-ERU4]